MPYELHAAIVDPDDGEIKVEHIFYGETESECEDYFEEHLDTCFYFKAAQAKGDVITWFDDVKNLPTRQSLEEELEDG